MRILAVTAILAFFAAAAFAGAEQRLETGAVCATIWMPVCAVKGGDSRTFANACLANAENWRVSQHGTCDGGNGRRISFCIGEDCRQPAAPRPATVR